MLNCRCCFRTRAKCYLSNRFVRERRTLCHFSWGARPIIPILSFYQVINLAVADTCSCFLNLKSSHFTLLLCEKIKRLTWAERLFYTLLPSVVNYICPMALKGHTKKKKKNIFLSNILNVRDTDSCLSLFFSCCQRENIATIYPFIQFWNPVVGRWWH